MKKIDSNQDWWCKYMQAFYILHSKEEYDLI